MTARGVSAHVAVILSNFNHERWVINARICSNSRFIVEETWRWANARHVFGKPLIEQPVIRAKFAKLFSAVEMGQLWLESLTYQMVNVRVQCTESRADRPRWTMRSNPSYSPDRWAC